jgi:uncharacterized protein DUF3800
MKLCYCDESGTGDEPIAVMVGIVVDAQRMHVTKEHWSELLIALSRVVGRTIEEIHTTDFYSGNGVWRGMNGPERSQVITEVFGWLDARRHHIVYSSVEKSAYYTSLKAGQVPSELATPWRFMGQHLLLSVQKIHQRQQKNKGHTIFVFDNEEREKMRFTDLVMNPPAWTDSYYDKGKKQARMDQIVDVPYFGDSKEVGLLQVADFVAYFLRRHAEIAGGYSKPRYPDEIGKIDGWIATLRSRCLGGSMMYPATGRCGCADLFYTHAPEVVRKLHRA